MVQDTADAKASAPLAMMDMPTWERGCQVGTSVGMRATENAAGSKTTQFLTRPHPHATDKGRHASSARTRQQYHFAVSQHAIELD